MSGMSGGGFSGKVTMGDGPHNDAFGRLRVSQPVLLVDLKRVGATPESGATMSGTTAYTTARASTYLIVGPGAGTSIRQSKVRGIYQPGKSLEAEQTFVLAPAQTNLRQRVGYFDDANGVFLELDDATLYWVVRSSVTGSPVNTRAAKAAWNIDRMDGTGPSGVTLDITKPQNILIDMQWLGVGRVRFGVYIGGRIVPCHEFNGSNDSVTSAYMGNPNLPIRWEITAKDTVTGSPQLEAICGSLNSEGGYDITGVTASADSGTTAKTIASGGFAEILAIRMQAGFTSYATAHMHALSIINGTSGTFRWRLVMNPTETGAGTWTAVPNCIAEKNTTRTVTVDTGTVVLAGYVSAQLNTTEQSKDLATLLGTTLTGVTDIWSLQINNLSNQSEDFYGSISFREVH